MSAGRRTTNRDPLVKIDYFGSDKELVFHQFDIESVNNADSVKIKTRKGFFGFDVIESYNVLLK